jgi:hypothetical protein
MSTATIENPTDSGRRTAAPRPRQGTAQAARPALVDARLHAETAVTDLIAATADTVRAFVPAAVLRPTEAVDHAFDLAEQALAAARRVCYEIAAIMESGLDGAAQRAA